MNAASQPIVAHYNQLLQQAAGQLQGLLQQSVRGCDDLIAKHPTDPIPLTNALTAIQHQVLELKRRVEDALSEHHDRLVELGAANPGYPHLRHGLRDFVRWADGQWMHFSSHATCNQYRVMWPHVQQALSRPAACTRCGGPLARKTPHTSESIGCTACRTVNQVIPDGVVATYFTGMPHAFAEAAVLEKRTAITKLKDDWDAHRDAEDAAGRERPDMPIAQLKQLEQMERDCWQTYAEARIKSEGGSPDDVRTLVEARMKTGFYDAMNMNDVWRRHHGLPSLAEQAQVPAHLANVNEWGPLDPRRVPNALEENWVHDNLLSEAVREPARHASLLKALGYQDATHRAMVHATFRRYYAAQLMTPEGQQLITRAAMRASNERMKYMTAASTESGALDPIEGISIEVYAGLSAKQASVSAEVFVSLLAQQQMDLPKWDRVSKGWLDRMQRDTSGVVATAYANGFAGQGQYGAMGAAATENRVAGQMGLQGPALGGGGGSGEPISFERYCEIGGAMQAWTKLGKDVNAGLQKHFGMSAMDYSNVSMYWTQKMMADLSMFEKQQALAHQAEAKFATMP
jgi:hypothetical protein